MKENNIIRNIKYYWNAIKRKHYCFTDLVCFIGMDLALTEVTDNLEVYLRIAMILMVLNLGYNTLKHLKLLSNQKHLKRDALILVVTVFYMLINFMI